MSSTYIRAREVLDQAAMLLNDPNQTDYKHDVLWPFLRMALDELSESLMDSQQSPTVRTTTVLVIKGANAIYPTDSGGTVAHYPDNLVEIQELLEKPASAGPDVPYLPMRRLEHLDIRPTADRLYDWTWSIQTIIFSPYGADKDISVMIKYIADVESPVGNDPDAIVGGTKSRSYLTYKTASYAAMFIGENQERAAILDAKAADALERIESINNKGRQQIMTRHKPFRAAWKARGGW